MLTPAIKAVCAKYGYKVTLSVRHSTSLVAKIKGAADIMEEYCKLQMTPEKVLRRSKDNGYTFSAERFMEESAKWGHDVNEYWIDDNYGEKGIAFLTELKSAMEGPGFYNEDDAMTDYFHRSHYIDIKVYA